uniref:Uncharacterized protein n=1 Tax=Helianthus annuus TaxID=4232 RepID=A0A251V0A3_HELAN
MHVGTCQGELKHRRITGQDKVLLGLLLPLRMISGRGSSRRARIVRKERSHSLKYVML